MRYILPTYLPCNEAITAMHASAELGRLGLSLDGTDDMLHKMKTDRNIVMDFGSEEVEKLIVHYCIKGSYTYHADLNGNPKNVRQIRSFRNVVESWRDDGSEVNASRMRNCMFDRF